MERPRGHREHRQGRRFCPDGGALLTLACPSRSFSNEPGERFCRECRRPLVASPSPAARFWPPESRQHEAHALFTPRRVTKYVERTERLIAELGASRSA
jgi:hypothetical protein